MATSTAILLLCLLGIFMPVQCQDDDSLGEEMNKTVSDLIEEANKNIGQEPGDPEIIDGDIAVPTGLQNADPCTASRCKWPSYRNGLVYIPYYISHQFSSYDKAVIERGLQSFGHSTCIRFIKRRTQRDYLNIKSSNGCWSYIGRQGGKQDISLGRGCVYRGTIQHELLHALGFQHEHKRSDRDAYVRILWDNIIQNMKHNFKKVATNNLGTSYDYGSIMHYSKTAFSRNGRPTIVAVPNPNVEFGKATEMSCQDIRRVNLLYGCN